MLSRLDPHSSYIGREELGQFRASVENEFGGIGFRSPSTAARSR